MISYSWVQAAPANQEERDESPYRGSLTFGKLPALRVPKGRIMSQFALLLKASRDNLQAPSVRRPVDCSPEPSLLPNPANYTPRSPTPIPPSGSRWIFCMYIYIYVCVQANWTGPWTQDRIAAISHAFQRLRLARQRPRTHATHEAAHPTSLGSPPEGLGRPEKCAGESLR